MFTGIVEELGTVKNIKKLKDKKYRDEAGLYIIEGVKMIEEAIVANAKIDKIVVCEECLKTGDIEQKLLYERCRWKISRLCEFSLGIY